MLERVVLKKGLGEVRELENATKKRSIRLSAETMNWPFWHIVELGEWCLINHMRLSSRAWIYCLLCMLGCFSEKSISQVLTGSLSQGVVVNYQFNGNTLDSSGNGYNATAVGAQLSADRFGRSSGAYLFNGSSDYIISGNSLPNSIKFTISAWIRPDALKFAGIFYDSALFTPGRDTSLHMYGDGSIEASFSKIGDPGPPYLRTGVVLSEGSWFHVVATSEATGLKIFLNGTEVASQNIGSDNIGYHSNIYIGAENHGFQPEFFFKGAIDDVLFYDKVLSPSEVSSLYQIQSIPEPSAFSLFAVGLGGWALVRRRRRS